LRHDAQADVSLPINLGGPCLISQGASELWLEEGGATLVSAADAGGLTHDPRGDVLTLPCRRVAPGSLARERGHGSPACVTHLGCGDNTDETHKTIDAIQTIHGAV